MTTPNLDAETQQTAEQEPEGIRMLRQEYPPEKVEAILESIRRGLEDRARGDCITFEQYLKERGLVKDDAL